MMPPIVGIDLGTTYSLVAVFQAGAPVILPNALGERMTASAVSLADDGAVLVGAPARARRTTHPQRTVLSFKRDMGTNRVHDLELRKLTAVELSAIVLGSLKRDAEAALGHAVEEAVITVPAYFGDDQRQATRDAGQIAGLRVERIINEPTAAALAYGLHQRHRELRAVVLDLGGGTFDVTVLEIMEGVIEIQSSAGDTRLGGDDFDLALAELLARRVTDGDIRADPRAWARTQDAAEGLKKRLSEAEEASAALLGLPVSDGRTISVETAVSRAEAEESWAPLLDRMRAPIQRALRDASLAPQKIDEILLVGGATRMPCVARLAAQMFGRLPLRALQPDEAVALGAAVQAALKLSDAAVNDMVVTDVAPFTMGIGTSAEHGGRRVDDVFTPIIERGTVIPVSREERFSTVEDFQDKIVVPIYQGEHALCRDNTKLGEVKVAVPRARKSQEQVDVRFTYDLNGILEVDVAVVSTRRRESVVIEGAPGRLTKAQVEQARRDMQRLKFHPREALPNTTALARADALYVELTGPARAALGSAIAALRAAIDAQDEQLIGPVREQLRRLMSELKR